MPYVDQRARTELDNGRPPETAGELTYVLTCQVDRYLSHRDGFRFADLAETVSALECAKLELYRRMVGPYEDEKIAEHGDVYTARVEQSLARAEKPDKAPAAFPCAGCAHPATCREVDFCRIDVGRFRCPVYGTVCAGTACNAGSTCIANG